MPYSKGIALDYYGETEMLNHNEKLTVTATKTVHLVAFLVPELTEAKKLEAGSHYLPHPAFYQTRCTRTFRLDEVTEDAAGKKACKTCQKQVTK
jgi:hypothetical protein